MGLFVVQFGEEEKQGYGSEASCACILLPRSFLLALQVLSPPSDGTISTPVPAVEGVKRLGGRVPGQSPPVSAVGSCPRAARPGSAAGGTTAAPGGGSRGPVSLDNPAPTRPPRETGGHAFRSSELSLVGRRATLNRHSVEGGLKKCLL